MNRPVEFITVPAGTPEAKCRASSCRAPIYWIERPRKGKPGTARIPVDCSVVGGRLPDGLSSGLGVNHFTTCTAADQF